MNTHTALKICFIKKKIRIQNILEFISYYCDTVCIVLMFNAISIYLVFDSYQQNYYDEISYNSEQSTSIIHVVAFNLANIK